MENTFKIVVSIWKQYLVHIVDIFVVSYIIYRLLILIKGTRAILVLRGLIVLILVTFLVQALNLPTLIWILRGFWVAGIVAIVIVFQPELRNILARLGRGPIIRTFMKEGVTFINEIIKALETLRKKRYGALIVLEQQIGLRDFIESGIIINGEVTKELLVSIFCLDSELHDGAVIIQNERLKSARCILPLTHEVEVSKILGTRHRAALGITEVSDAWAIVLSEEDGRISLAREKRLERNIDLKQLKAILINHYKKVENKHYFRG